MLFPLWIVVQDRSLTSWRRILDEDHLAEELGRIANFPKLKVLGWSDQRRGIIRPLTLTGPTRELDGVPTYPLFLVTHEITTGKELRLRVRSPEDVEETIQSVARGERYRITGWAELNGPVRSDFEALLNEPPSNTDYLDAE